MSPRNKPSAAEPESGQRTYMRVSHHSPQGLNQETLQRNWCGWKTKRHREYSLLNPPGSRPVEWTNRVEVRCGHSETKIGFVVAFKTDDTYGIVVDTSRWSDALVSGRGQGKPPAIWIEGDLRKAQAHFRCRRCRRGFVRNAHRLGQQIVEEDSRKIRMT